YPDGIQTCKDGWWRRTTPYSNTQNTVCLDYLSVTVNSMTNKVYYASFQHGLTEWDLGSGNISVFDNTNSILGREQCCNVVRIPSVCTDNNGNVWMTNTGVNKPIALLKPDGTWKNFSVP